MCIYERRQTPCLHERMAEGIYEHLTSEATEETRSVYEALPAGSGEGHCPSRKQGEQNHEKNYAEIKR